MAGTLPGEPAGHQADDAQQLKEEIERTREHLGATVEQLAAKVDVKSRMRAQAAELTGRVKGAAAKARGQAAAKAGKTRAVIVGKPADARQKGASATAREHWLPLAAAAVGAALAVAALALWRRREAMPVKRGKKG